MARSLTAPPQLTWDRYSGVLAVRPGKVGGSPRLEDGDEAKGRVRRRAGTRYVPTPRTVMS